MHIVEKTVALFDFWTPGPLKGWKSVKRIHVSHFNVTKYMTLLYGLIKIPIEIDRLVHVEVHFNNGMYYNTSDIYEGADVDVTQTAIYAALKEYSTRARLIAA
jgi:hypothetical protein